MPVILGALAVLAAAVFWIQRARNAAQVGHDLVDVAKDIRLTARRFGFQCRSNVHPAETIEDPQIALAALGASVLELDDYLTAEQKRSPGTWSAPRTADPASGCRRAGSAGTMDHAGMRRPTAGDLAAVTSAL